MRLLIGSIAFVLAACSPADQDAEESLAVDGETTAAPIAASPDPASSPEAITAAAVATIPEQFRGKWDYVQGTCAPESDLRLEVTANDLMFYESVGEVESVKVENDNQVVVELSMSGEGETWTERTRLTLTNGGNMLTPVDADGEQAGTPMPRERCE